MRKLTYLLILLFCLISLPTQGQESASITFTDATGNEVTIESLDRIVSANGDVTEIIAALGFYDRLVGVDSSSTYPPQTLEEIEEIGFGRALSLEPIVAVDPTVVFCTQVCGPSEVFEGLQNLGIPVVIVPDAEDGGLEMPFPKIEMVAAALGVPEQGAQLSERVHREIEWSQTAVANVETQPAVMHIYIRGRGLQLAVGSGTPADAMILGAGGINVAAEVGVSGYEPLSGEIILSAFPEWLLLTEGNVENSGGLDALLETQGLNGTPAVLNDQIIIMDTGLLLGMSVRTGQALLQLESQLYPEMTWELAPAYPYTVTDTSGTEVTVEEPLPIFASNEELLGLSRSMGFHSEPLETPTAGSIILASSEDDWENWREAGAVVLVVNNPSDIAEVAGLLNVPGRGEALQAAQ